MRLSVLLAIQFLALTSATAQVVPVGDPLEDYARFLQLSGEAPASSFSIRPVVARKLVGEGGFSLSDHPWRQELVRRYAPMFQRGLLQWGVLDGVTGAFWNSTRPYGTNDGALWQGRGSSLAFTTGVFARVGPISGAFRPQWIYTQNADFEMWPGSSFAYPGRESIIDRPQRFGPDPYTTFDLGESYVRVDYKGAALGFSNENLWWGPGYRNAIIMSNNAPGFRHAFLGTSGPVGTPVGQLQARWIWGKLSESDYFAASVPVDERYLSGIALDYGPRFLPGFYVGLTRVFMRLMPERRLTAGEYFIIFQNIFKVYTEQDPFGYDAYDQMLSAYIRWLIPESGFEAYAEFARGDHSANERDLVTEPEHGSAYTIGLQKLSQPLHGGRLRIAAELTKLQAPRTVLLRGEPNTTYFYAHQIVRQGYTQRGQVMGAGIGPGSNTQFLGADWFAQWGKAGVFAQRTVYDADRYYSRDPETESNLEVELAAGLQGLVFFRGFEIGGSLTLARLLNQHYVYKNDHFNLHATLTVRKSLMGFR